MDSGVGGLAVLKRFVEQMPESPYIFMGDTAWMPYGEKPLSVVRDRVLKVHHWIDTHYPLAVFVLACNTATVAAYDTLAGMELPYPLLEPVKTTSEWVNAHLSSHQNIGILATPATVSGKRYLQFLNSAFEVTQVPCTGLASVIEQGICNGPVLDEVLLPYLEPLQSAQVEVIILGCTHYSLIRDIIQEKMGPQVKIIDSAEILAHVAIPIIQNLHLGNGHQQMMVTGSAPNFAQAIQKLPLRELQNKSVVMVPVDAESARPQPLKISD